MRGHANRVPRLGDETEERSTKGIMSAISSLSAPLDPYQRRFFSPPSSSQQSPSHASDTLSYSPCRGSKLQRWPATACSGRSADYHHEQISLEFLEHSALPSSSVEPLRDTFHPSSKFCVRVPLNTRQDSRDVICWTPPVLQDVQAQLSGVVNVWVEHLTDEADRRSLVGVAFVKVHD